MSRPEIKRLDHLAWLLDSSIRVPGTQWRIGLDGLIGLIPGIGDLIAGALSSYIILQSIRAGASIVVVANMVLNVLLETIVGVIPVFGDIFDFAFKANQRNLKLLHAYLDNPSTVKKKSAFKVFIAVFLVIAMFTLIIATVVALLKLIFTAIF